MKPTSRNSTPLLAALVLLSLMVAAFSPILPTSAAQNGSAGPSLHRLHFEYDKATGQRLDDPTAQTLASAAAEAEVEAFFARKRENVDPTRITFRSGITIHPQPGMEPGVREALTVPSHPGFDRLWLIQFRYPFPTEARSRLQDAGVAFYDYVDVCGFFARVPPEALPLLEEMLEEGLVRYVGGIPAEAKVHRALAAEAALRPAAEREIVVLTFDEPTPAQLEELGRWMAIEGRSTGLIHIVGGTASGASIQGLANLGFVRWVEEQGEAELGNLDGGMGVGADIVRAAGFDGTDVQVMVVDSGIAQQADSHDLEYRVFLPIVLTDSSSGTGPDGITCHPDLECDRILDQYDYQAIPQDDDATDDYEIKGGHGTHVAGTIGGRYNSGDPNSNQSYRGMAPDASFLIYRLFGPDSSFSDVWFAEALLRATSDGRRAHVSNNSWAEAGSYDQYTVTSQMADAAVRGEFNERPVNVVAAAMNDSYYVRAPGTGKNVITVGAVKDGNYPNSPFTYACNGGEIDWPPGERVCYSNYGPIDTDGDGSLGDAYKRVKPDLMAPGAMITSAVPWYLYEDGRYYNTFHGTSMATPHVTGAIAQLLDAYSEVEEGALFDWPEMVKAMLLAAAVDVGGDTKYYGHGLLDAYHAIYAEPGVDEPMDVWGSSFSSSGETRDFTFNVPPGYEEVRVVLTWADPPGATEAINDLDVVEIRDGGDIWRGSAISSDDMVEYAHITTGVPGTWTVRAAAESLTDQQPFALAAHVIMADADLSIEARPASVPGTVPSFVPGGEFYLHQYVSNSGYTAGGSYAQLHVPEGFTVMGVTVYTEDEHEHWYDASELYHDPIDGPDDYYVALGETLAEFERHVRWYIDIDEVTECGGYPFVSRAFWLEGGDQHASSSVNTQVPVACHFTYLPLVLRGY